MTVRELIQALRRYPPDLRVVVDGYEEGYDDLSPARISAVRIVLDTGTQDYVGQHSDQNELPDAALASATLVDALALHRSSH